jgi:hypothetical protein
MERILASDPAARLMVVGAHEDPYVMPMRWREGADRVFANGIWVRCEECGFIGVEDFYQWDRMFWLAHEAWRCPTCDHRGFDPISPWVSPQYRRYQELTTSPSAGPQRGLVAPVAAARSVSTTVAAVVAGAVMVAPLRSGFANKTKPIRNGRNRTPTCWPA